MSLVSLYLYVPEEGSSLPKYRYCTTSNDFELYSKCCGVMLPPLITYTYSRCDERTQRRQSAQYRMYNIIVNVGV